MPRPGTTRQRGYGYKHKKLREQVKQSVLAGRAICWRCELPISPTAEWDLGHSLDRTTYMGPEHARAKDCPAGGNRATYGRERPRTGSQPKNVDTSRDW